MTVVLSVAAAGDRPALRLRPWAAADMPGLLAAMAREYPDSGLRSHPDVVVPGPQRWSGPRDEEEAALWLSGQERGWKGGDWLTFAVLDGGGRPRLRHRARRGAGGDGLGVPGAPSRTSR